MRMVDLNLVMTIFSVNFHTIEVTIKSINNDVYFFVFFFFQIFDIQIVYKFFDY